jgi:V8-like Glu-specific endopeptidase
MHKSLRLICLAASAPLALLWATNVVAADGREPPHIDAKPGTDAAVRAYWTPERLTHAQSADRVVSGALRRGHGNRTAPAGEPQIVSGKGPTEDYDFSLATTLYDDTQQIQRGHPPLVGTGAIPYTTNRLYPQNDKQLYKVYPYATVGHLYFTEPGGDFQCSASVIRNSTIATAGHCVGDGNSTYYTNWLFIPAQNGSKAPFGSWTWSNAITTSAWYSGGGAVPNEQDDAVIILNTQKYKKKLHAIGDLVGYLGYEFDAPLPTAITQLGYPCNLDSCSDPIATYSQDTAGSTNNFQWGTASFGGASGGPELQDFGQAPSGVPTESFGGNILVSSTSYTYTDTSVQVDGGSILYSPGQNGEYTFGDDINFACSANGC